MINKMDFISQLGFAQDTDQLAIIVGQFLYNQGYIDNIAIVKHQIHLDAIQLIYSTPETIEPTLLAALVRNFKPKLRPFEGQRHQEYNYCFLDRDYCSEDSFIIISKNAFGQDVLDSIKIWDAFDRTITRVNSHCQDNLQTEYANLTSQLLHDIQSLITLSDNPQSGEALIIRKNYQKTVNQNLLFYLRDAELIAESTPLKELIAASLDLINIDPTKLNLRIPEKPADITVDVELFSRALNELVKNARDSVDNDLSKISIDIDSFDSSSPFCRYPWLKITISDQGQGINKDYLPLVLLPFFTTTKEKGSSGFGLTIARKIIEAHKGHLEISSEQGCGTQVIIYLPLIEHG